MKIALVLCALQATAAQYSTLKVHRACLGAYSDHYAMWEIGVPAVVYAEHSPFNNPHFDRKGGDTPGSNWTARTPR